MNEHRVPAQHETPEERAERGGHSALVRRTTHGVAHISASSWADLGFGQGWAIACDHLPTIADQIVKVRSERARFHGAGPGEVHLSSDLGYKVLGLDGQAERFRQDQPAYVRELIGGYVAGYNHRVGEVLADRTLLPRWCRDAEWIRPISDTDLYRYLVDVALMGSGRNLAGLIGSARPPGPDGPYPPADMAALGGPAGASNGWAFGRAATASGGGLVFANPHFPWTGEARFWECHLTIPGELDVYGVCLLGAPGVQMGFNENVAWAHTFSRGSRFTVYQLTLGSDPTSYHYGDEVRSMTSATHAVEVLRDGRMERVEREMWSTHHGPMLNLPLLGWGEQAGFSYRDANLDNTAVLTQFLGMAQSESIESMREVFHRVKGMPWVNTLAADRTGSAWYCDASATPNLGPDAEQRFRQRLETDMIAAIAYDARLVLLNGSDPGDEWIDEPGARSPGLVAPDRLPELLVDDVVVNANDSHWLSHPSNRLEGYPVLCGLEGTPRTLRTRQNLLTAGALAEKGSVSIDDVADALFNGSSLSARLLRDQVVERCAGSEDPLVVAAGDVLATWGLTMTLDDPGAALWREFMGCFDDNARQTGTGLFATLFDIDNPISTPVGLVRPDESGADPVLAAVRASVDALTAAGLPMDVTLRDCQWAVRGEQRVPVPGGDEGDGVLNVMTPTGVLASSSLDPLPPRPEPIPGRDRTGLGIGGYQETYGTSFVMIVELTAEGPRGKGLLAYGQSGDDRSPHHSDGTAAFAEANLRPLRFSEEDILADPNLTTVMVRA